MADKQDGTSVNYIENTLSSLVCLLRLSWIIHRSIMTRTVVGFIKEPTNLLPVNFQISASIYFTIAYLIFLTVILFIRSGFESSLISTFLLTPKEFPLAASILPIVLASVTASLTSWVVVRRQPGNRELIQKAVFWAYGYHFVLLTVWVVALFFALWLISLSLRFYQLIAYSSIVLLMGVGPALLLLPTAIINQTIIDHFGGPYKTKFGRRSEERRVGKECRSRWSPYN